jgi:mercuric ion transport protein
MHPIVTDLTPPLSEPDKQRGLLATGSVIGALLASSCCIIPFVLISLGVSGAWIGQLSALEPFKPYFLGVTAFLLAAGFWHVYFKKPERCQDGSFCERPSSSRVTKSALWVATLLVLLAASIDYWAPLFY